MQIYLYNVQGVKTDFCREAPMQAMLVRHKGQNISIIYTQKTQKDIKWQK